MNRMLKRLQIFLLLIFASLASLLNAAPGKVQALFSYSTFLMAGKSAYIETYLMVRGNSVVLRKTENNTWQGTVEVLLTVTEGEKVRYIDRYNLLSPESKDSMDVSFNFIDQQRIPVGNGKFDLSISIRDINTKAEPVNAVESLAIDYPRDSVCISDISLIDSYTNAEKPGPLTKGGYNLIPHISQLVLEDEGKLTFYSEIYHTLSQLGENQKFVANYFLTNEAGLPLPDYSGFKKFTAAEVSVLMAELNIKTLVSGNYFLKIEVRDKDNNLLDSGKITFYRSNPPKSVELENVASVSLDGSFALNYKSIDSLTEHIRCLAPISSEREKTYANNLLRTKDLKMMQQYFLSFWQNRDMINAHELWDKYYLEVKKVQKEFSTSIRRGYNTDRGRVYLQYGPPDNRTVSMREPSAYPYEIWQYYKVKKQSNRRFVFYNPDLVTNDYSLIHSDALGEIMNEQWQMLILKRDSQNNDIDQIDANPHYGTQIQQNFQTPR